MPKEAERTAQSQKSIRKPFFHPYQLTGRLVLFNILYHIYLSNFY